MSRASDDGRPTSSGSAFSSLAIVGYRRLWFAGTFAFLSVQMQFLLRGVLAWDLTEREGALGLVYLCFGVTMLSPRRSVGWRPTASPTGACSW